MTHGTSYNALEALSKSALAKELLLAERGTSSLEAQEAQLSPPKRQRIAEGQDSDDDASSSITPFESEVQLYLIEPNLPLFNVCPHFIDPEKDTKTWNDPLLYWRERMPAESQC